MEQLFLKEVEKGQTIRLVAGKEGEGFVYEFEVLEPGERPECLITQTNPEGKVVGPSLVRLEGTGRWTTQKENPVQTQWRNKAFTIGWGMLNTGGLLSVIAVESEMGPNQRYVFENPPISDIQVESAKPEVL